MTNHAGNIKNLTEALVRINEAKQGMALLDQKIHITRLLENEVQAMEKCQAAVK